MLARYRINKAKYMKGGAELAKPPKGGFDLPPIKQEHNSMSAALQDHQDQQAKAAEIQQQINQSGGVSAGTQLDAPPGTVEVEGHGVLNPEQNKAITGIRELQMRAAADEALDGPRQKGGKRKRKKSRKKRKRWPPKRKSRRRKKSKGGDFHISDPKLSDDNKRDILKRYHNVTQIGPLSSEYKKGGKRKKRTRKKKKRRRRKKSRRKR